MKNVHVSFLLSVSLVAASLQLLIYTESTVCEAASLEEGWNPNSSTTECSLGYGNVPWAAASLCSKCRDSCNFLLLLQVLNVCGLINFANEIFLLCNCTQELIEIIKTCVQFVAHVVGYCNLLLSQVMHSKQFCRKWSGHTSTTSQTHVICKRSNATPQTHVPGNCKWSNAIMLLDPSLACEFSIPFYNMFNTSNLTLCTRKDTCMKTSVARLMRYKNPPVPMPCDQSAYVWGRCWCQGTAPLEPRDAEPKVQGVMTWHHCLHLFIG